MPSVKSVSLLVDEATEKSNFGDAVLDEEDQDETLLDPEIAALADQIAQDPMLIKERINLISQLGVIGERKNIGLNFLVIVGGVSIVSIYRLEKEKR